VQNLGAFMGCVMTADFYEDTKTINLYVNHNATGTTDASVNYVSLGDHTNSTKISVFPKIICTKFVNLTHLFVINVGVEIVKPNTFKKLKNLNMLGLGLNQIGTLKANTFKGASALQRLALNSNKIQTIHKKAFSGLTSLLIVDLSLNLISKLDPATFTPLPKIEAIVLLRNKLVTLPATIFQSNVNLTVVNLADNLITSLPEIIFDKNSRLTTLAFSGNTCPSTNYITTLPEFVNLTAVKAEIKACTSA
jgi:Leucine-rich repeat (LRR) protein